jgi:hypothetical protein
MTKHTSKKKPDAEIDYPEENKKLKIKRYLLEKSLKKRSLLKKPSLLINDEWEYS